MKNLLLPAVTTISLLLTGFVAADVQHADAVLRTPSVAALPKPPCIPGLLGCSGRLKAPVCVPKMLSCPKA